MVTRVEETNRYNLSMAPRVGNLRLRAGTSESGEKNLSPLAGTSELGDRRMRISYKPGSPKQWTSWLYSMYRALRLVSPVRGDRNLRFQWLNGVERGLRQ